LKSLKFSLNTSLELSGSFKENLTSNLFLPLGVEEDVSLWLICALNILTEEGKPLHVNELAQLLQQRFGRLTDRDTLSSALAKKARRGILLRQSAPATFTLIDSKEDHHETT